MADMITSLFVPFRQTGTTAYRCPYNLGRMVSWISQNNSLTQITTGNVTWNSTNVTGDQTRRVWQKIGRLVIVNLEFTPKSGKIVNENEICSGLPVPYNADYAVFGGKQQQVKLWGTGKLQWYFPEDTSTLKRTELLLVYFASTY